VSSADLAGLEDGEGQSMSDLASQVARVAAPVREQVLELLRREIVELRLRPGQRLVERELIERIGVSRTTIREALRQLAAEGLVTTIPQKGAIVAVPSAREAAEVYEVRALLEGAAAKAFAQNASEAQVHALRQAFEAVADRASSVEDGAFLGAKNCFYEVLFEGAGNSTIRTILESLQARVAVLRATTVAVPGRPRVSVDEIRAIVEALERRAPDAAEAAAAHHVRQAAATLFSQLETAASAEGSASA
jgi:GntR family transcriptional regulator, trigonelline degradation regulator